MSLRPSDAGTVAAPLLPRGFVRAALIAALLAAGAPTLPGPSTAARAKAPGPPPRVRAHYPGSATLGVASDFVSIKFNRPLDPATLGDGSFAVHAGIAEVAGAWYLDPDARGKVAIFLPSAPLAKGTAHRVRVLPALRSETGVAAVPYEFRFVTAGDKPSGGPVGEPDPDARLRRTPATGPRPRVVFTFPGAGFGNTFADEVRVRFLKPVDFTSFDAASFRVLQDGVHPVEGSIEPVEETGGREAAFHPAHPFFRATRFEVVLSPWVRSARGRLLEEEFRFGFGTSPLKEGVRPINPDELLPGPELVQGRAFHTASTVLDGDVLLAGGQEYAGGPLASAERFVRATGVVVPAAAMETARRKHGAVTLKDGRVFVCGGFGVTGIPLASAELYDPVNDLWIPAASMVTDRAHHTLSLLADGRVLAAGGFRQGAGGLAYAGTTEIFSPSTGTWSPGPSFTTARGGHTATTMKDGRILFAGGDATISPTAEIYTPVAGTLLPAPSLPNYYRIFHAAALTKSGTVLLAGGGPAPSEQYDPATGTFVPAGSLSPVALQTSNSPDFATLTPISEGRIALLGGLAYGGNGDGSDVVLAQLQVWHASGGGGFGGFFPMQFTMEVPRAAHTVTPLGDGRYLVAGGFGTGAPSEGNERRLTILAPE
jgi:hypothetical protein